MIRLLIFIVTSMVGIAQAATTTTVVFPMLQLTGRANNAPFTVRLDGSVMLSGTNIVYSRPITINPVAGFSRTNLIPGNYILEIDGKQLRMPVPESDQELNAAELITSGATVSTVAPTFPTRAELQVQLSIASNAVLGVAMGALNRSMVYVDAVAGNDLTGARESAVKPFASVTAAATVALPGDTIALIRGTFSESGITLASNVNLFMSSGTRWTVDVQVGAVSDGTTDWAFSAPGEFRVSGQGDVVVNRGFLARVGKNATFEINSFDVIEEGGGVQGLFVPTASNLTPKVKVSIAQPSGFVYCFSSPMPNFPGLAIEYEIRIAKETGSVLYGVYPWSKVIRFVDSDMWQVSDYDLLPGISVEFVRCKVQANPVTGSQFLIRDVEFAEIPTDSTLFIGNGFVR